MKKAFEQNVSRSRPRVKLGSLLEEATSPEEDDAPTPLPQARAPAAGPKALVPEAIAPTPEPVAPRATAAPRAPETESPSAVRRGAEAVEKLLARHSVPVVQSVPKRAAATPAAAEAARPAP